MSGRFALRKDPDAAFESLYRRHVHDVYRYALAVLGSPADAEDVTQTTFLNAYRAFQRGETPRKPGNWLRTIAHNVCRQRFRQASRRPREIGVEGDLADELVVEDSDAPSPEDIAGALRNIPFNQRAALVMRELEGLSQAEIAGALDLSVSAVETLLFRARRALREQLEHCLTCGEAARAISRQLSGSTSRTERAALRAHLRQCPECATFARRARAQRKALKRLAAVPLPAALLSWSGGTATSAGLAAPAGGIGAKVAAGIAIAAVAVGAGDQGIQQLTAPPKRPPHAPADHHPERDTAGVLGAPGQAVPPAAHSIPTSAQRKPKHAHSRPARKPRKPPHGGKRRNEKSPRHAAKPPKPRHRARPHARRATENPPRKAHEREAPRTARRAATETQTDRVLPRTPATAHP
jgi:RNA polymerase sigma factor (sigma-70 family)